MKTGRTLTELAAEIERQQNAKHDMIAPTALIEMDAEDGINLRIGSSTTGVRQFGINEVGHDQIGNYVSIPSKYYDRMRTAAPDLLAANVNRWLHFPREKPEKRMVRTLDGQVRAFLSDSYRPLENYDLAEAVLPVLMDLKLEIMSCQVTERRLYIKAVDQRIKKDIPAGKRLGDGSHTFFDTVSPAVIIANSEVGLGALSVESGVFTKVCTNLAAIAGAGMKKRHLGSRFDAGEEIRHLLTDETRKATDKAVWLQVRDVVKGAFEEARFQAHVDAIKDMTEQRIEPEADVVKVVDLASRKLGITEGESKSVLRHLIEGGDLTRYGLFNAVTRAAQDLESYDRASEFERLGGQVITLPTNDWREIAMAA